MPKIFVFACLLEKKYSLAGMALCLLRDLSILSLWAMERKDHMNNSSDLKELPPF
jgi:hypothetical protein